MPKLPTSPSDWLPPSPMEGPPLPKWMLHSQEIRFTTRVLGHDAADRLRDKKITQTIRSDKGIRYKNIGDINQVTLDGEVIGEVEIMSIDKVILGDLDEEDAARGGFDDIDELRRALSRAFRRSWDNIWGYIGNRVEFSWV